VYAARKIAIKGETRMTDESKAVDQPKAQDNKPETGTQEETMPVTEQKTPDAEGQAEVKGELPEDATQRTKEQFDKLKSNYREERDKRIKMEKEFQAMQLKPQPQKPTGEDWFNAETGEVDLVKLREERGRETNRIAKLEQQVQGVQKQTQAQQEKEVFDLYPELNPSGEEFNEPLHDAVSGYITTQLLKGNNPTFKEGAEAVLQIGSSESQKTTQKAEKAGAKKALEQLSPKERASLEATGRSDKRPQSKDLDFLSRESRRGDSRGVEAIYERLKGITQVGK